MKRILAFFLLLGSFSASAEIVKHSDSDLDADLGFKLEDDVKEKSERQVASENEKDNEEGERELASEQDDSGVQFWKFKEE